MACSFMLAVGVAPVLIRPLLLLLDIDTQKDHLRQLAISTASSASRCCTPFPASMGVVLVKMGSGKHPTSPTHGTSTAGVIEPNPES